MDAAFGHERAPLANYDGPLMTMGHTASERDADKDDGQARAEPGSTRRLGGLDGLRAVAATAVVFHHVGFDSGATFRQPATQFLGRADIGVPIFFVLSGFLLYRPFVARLLDGGAAPSRGEFWLKRFLRVYPAYWVALAVMLIAGGIAVRGPYGLFFSATLTHSYHLRRAISGITQSWSLVTEIAFYLMLPFWHQATVALSRRRPVNQRAALVLVGLAGLYVFSVVFRVLVAVINPQIRGITPQWFLGQSDIFALGMALALGHAWARHNPRVRELILGSSHRIGRWYLGAAVCFWLVATQFDLAVGLTSASTVSEIARQFFYGVIAFALVLPIAWGGGLSSRFGRVLDSRVFRYLGRVSYGVYLWHQWILGRVISLLGFKLFGGHFWVLVTATLLGSVAVAELSQRFVEQPLAKLVPRVLARRSWSRVRLRSA
jgi:peptidoglycan/LPS O-acetylase OafA/YrhL